MGFLDFFLEDWDEDMGMGQQRHEQSEVWTQKSCHSKGGNSN